MKKDTYLLKGHGIKRIENQWNQKENLFREQPVEALFVILKKLCGPFKILSFEILIIPILLDE